MGQLDGGRSSLIPLMVLFVSAAADVGTFDKNKLIIILASVSGVVLVAFIVTCVVVAVLWRYVYVQSHTRTVIKVSGKCRMSVYCGIVLPEHLLTKFGTDHYDCDFYHHNKFHSDRLSRECSPLG